MEHKLISDESIENSISIIEFNNEVVIIKISNNELELPIALSKKELHSLIGTLLHVQQKMK